MGHEMVIFGCIAGSSPDALLELNSEVIAQLPEKDGWPSLVRGMFAMPVIWPVGTYQSHIIHFGASFKDEPGEGGCWDTWLSKFEALLQRLYWDSATVHLTTEFGPECVFHWVPIVDPGASDRFRPVSRWERRVRKLV